MKGLWSRTKRGKRPESRARSGVPKRVNASPGIKASSSGSSKRRRRISKSRCSDFGGNGFRTHSHIWFSSTDNSAHPITKFSASADRRQRLKTLPSTDSSPRLSTSKRSHASSGRSWTGVAVAKSRLRVRSAILYMKRRRLFGSGASASRFSPRLRRLA